MTMQDIADLAKVRRPVVSMWRNRASVRGVSMPFPSPVETIDGVDHFSPAEVVEYLRRSGRGNNPDASLDAPAVAVPDGASWEEVITLLAWRVITGEELSGTTYNDRVRTAAEHDPDDSLLLREIRQLHPSDTVLQYVDDLMEASFGPSDALARLDGGRLKRQAGGRELTAGAVELLSVVVKACAVHLGSDGVALRTDGNSLSVRVAAQANLSLVTDDRSVRRRAMISDVVVDCLPTDRAITFVSAIGQSLPDVLDAADDLVLDLPRGQVAVLVGSAEVLTDNLKGELQYRRASILRVGNVVAAIRLSRGLWREAHRQSLALWVCLGAAEVDHPWVADLGAVEQLELTDLAADVAGALGRNENRAYRYARRIDLAGVLVSGPLVPRGVKAPVLRAAEAIGHVERVHAATLVTTEPLATLDIFVRPSPGRLRLRHRSLGELRDDKQLNIKRGNRINEEGASPEGTVIVLPHEHSRGIAFDPLDAEQRYPRAVRTEPGDVIFVERPRPRAWVDHRGGAMVASPARILRLSATAEFGPRLLAAIINGTAPIGSEWQTWAVPEMSKDEADRIEAALDEIERFEAEAHRRIDAVNDLTKALIDGVAAGALTLDAESTTPGITAAHTEKGH
ncbi:hypothetical protein A5692_18765 [Mycobacterium sp. E342]|nr:hypothetical protein A5692_18765 [Mycobacterium sp. E342]